MKKIFCLTVVLVLCLSSLLIAQNVIDEDNGFNGIFVTSVGASGSNFYAQSFIADVPAITKFGVVIKELNSEGEIILAIAADDGFGYPDVNAPLYQGTLINPSVSGAWFYEDGINVNVTVGQKYWVLIDGYDNVGATGTAGIGLSENLTDTDERMIFSNSGGTSWNIYGQSIAIYVEGSPGIYPITFEVADTISGDTVAMEGVNIKLEGYEDKLTNVLGLAVYDSVNCSGDTIEWSASKFGYYTQTGSLVVTDTTTIFVLLEPLPTYNVTFKVSSLYGGSIAGAAVNLDVYGNINTNASGIAVFSSVFETSSPGIPYKISAAHYLPKSSNLILTSDTVIEVNLIQSVGINEKFAESIDVYPNPAHDFVTIVSPEEIHTMDIISMQGTVIKTVFGDGKKSQLNTSELPDGNYLLIIHTVNNTCIKRLTIVDW